MASNRLAWLKGRMRPSPSLILFIGFIPVIAFFRNNVADLAAVNGESMYPFLNDNKDQSLKRDWFLNWKWGIEKNLERGMVVTFR
jgi:inner membrane protease subunit 2